MTDAALIEAMAERVEIELRGFEPTSEQWGVMCAIGRYATAKIVGGEREFLALNDEYEKLAAGIPGLMIQSVIYDAGVRLRRPVQSFRMVDLRGSDRPQFTPIMVRVPNRTPFGRYRSVEPGKPVAGYPNLRAIDVFPPQA